LDIGSEDCKFDRKATITLLGKVTDAGPTVSGFGRKFLGVAMGGTIELHGVDPSPAWTKLAKTAHSGVSMGGASLTALDRGFNIAGIYLLTVGIPMQSRIRLQQDLTPVNLLVTVLSSFAQH
jgi:hypothetical protein